MSKAVVTFNLNGQPRNVKPGSTVLAALYDAGLDFQRRSVGGEPRSGICGMGICFECRVTIDGVPQQRACMITVRPGMEVRTDD